MAHLSPFLTPNKVPGMDGVDVDQPIGNTLSESRIYFVAF